MTDRRSMADDLVLEALRSLRSLLAMDVAFVSEFRDGRRVFRHVDSGDASIPVGVGPRMRWRTVIASASSTAAFPA